MVTTAERNPNRDKAKRLWIESKGCVTTKNLAATVGVSEQSIRRWRKEDNWEADTGKKRRGGQKGNKNAVGHGAPEGNKNAEVHGAYSQVDIEALTQEEREYIEYLAQNTEAAMKRELQLLLAKERDLAQRIKQYEMADPGELYVDRATEMLTPKDDGEDEGELCTRTLTLIKASPFDRIMRLEAAYDKVHGRILKLHDSMRVHNLDTSRLDLEERKHKLSKQKLSGEYDIDPDTGEIIDNTDGENA